MGHAGAWAGIGEVSAQDKWNLLESAGVVMVDHPAKFGQTMKKLIPSSSISRFQVCGSNVLV
jgi:succinyl-CoA synthetase alpha subunit